MVIQKIYKYKSGIVTHQIITSGTIFVMVIFYATSSCILFKKNLVKF